MNNVTYHENKFFNCSHCKHFVLQIVLTKIDKASRHKVLKNLFAVVEACKQEGGHTCFSQPFLVRWEHFYLARTFSTQKFFFSFILVVILCKFRISSFVFVRCFENIIFLDSLECFSSWGTFLDFVYNNVLMTMCRKLKDTLPHGNSAKSFLIWFLYSQFPFWRRTITAGDFHCLRHWMYRDQGTVISSSKIKVCY